MRSVPPRRPAPAARPSGLTPPKLQSLLSALDAARVLVMEALQGAPAEPRPQAEPAEVEKPQPPPQPERPDLPRPQNQPPAPRRNQAQPGPQRPGASEEG